MGYSAQKISDKLCFNRNTINEDIKYWYGQFSKELDDTEPRYLAIRQIQRLEYSRDQMIEEMLEMPYMNIKCNNRLMLMSLDDRISNIVKKLLESQDKSKK